VTPTTTTVAITLAAFAEEFRFQKASCISDVERATNHTNLD
jgi:hypothetical protein